MILGLPLDKLLFTDGATGEKMVKDNWINLQDKGIKAGRVQFFNNLSSHMIKYPGKVWIGVEFFCNDSEAFWLQTDELIIAPAHQ